MENSDYTLIVVISNMILTPFLQYLLHSRCSEINCCCINCKRDIKEDNESV